MVDLDMSKWPDPSLTGSVEFTCEGCGIHVLTFRWINYRTFPPSIDLRNLCSTCKEESGRAFKHG